MKPKFAIVYCGESHNPGDCCEISNHFTLARAQERFNQISKWKKNHMIVRLDHMGQWDLKRACMDIDLIPVGVIEFNDGYGKKFCTLTKRNSKSRGKKFWITTNEHDHLQNVIGTAIRYPTKKEAKLAIDFFNS